MSDETLTEDAEKPKMVEPDIKRPRGRPRKHPQTRPIGPRIPKGGKNVKGVGKTKVQISRQQWAEIDALWASGTVNYDFLMKRFGKSRETFQKHFMRAGIKHGSELEKHKKKIMEEVEKTLVGDATVVAGRIRETREDHYKMSSALARLAWEEIVRVRKENLPMSTATNNLRALDNAINVIKKAREERYACLGLDRDGPKQDDAFEELVIHELTADQVEALRNRDHTEFDELNDNGVSNTGEDYSSDDDDDDDGSDDDGVVEEL